VSEVTVLLFGRVREIVGAPEVRMPAAPGETAATLVESLVARHPALAEWKPFIRVAVNREYAPAERAVAPGDEIALIPPVSGG
jgi:molybdopterin converting factor subunit 1